MYVAAGDQAEMRTKGFLSQHIYASACHIVYVRVELTDTGYALTPDQMRICNSAANSKVKRTTLSCFKLMYIKSIFTTLSIIFKSPTVKRHKKEKNETIKGTK